MGMYDNYVETEYVWELGKVNTVLTEVIKENWNQGYDDGQSFGQNEVIGYLRTIAKLYGGIDEHLQSLIFDENDAFLQLQDFADELEKREKARPLFVNQLDTMAIADIQSRLMALGCYSNSEINEMMNEKIIDLIPAIDDEELANFEDSISWAGDGEQYDNLCDAFHEAQLQRRKEFGYEL